MSASLYFGIKLAVFIAIIIRALCVGSKVSRKEWNGHSVRFLMMALGYSLLSGGAAFWLFEIKAAYLLFAAGLSLMLISNTWRKI